jgi:hypothetical protein
MASYANILAAASVDATYYANALTMVATVADNDLSSGVTPDPIPVLYYQAILADITFTITGGPATTSIYVVLQGDMGDSNWMDLAWVVTTATTASQVFFLSAGGQGDINNALPIQTRTAGTAPASNSSIAIPLPARMRFVGRATFTGGASPAAKVTIKYRMSPVA